MAYYSSSYSGSDHGEFNFNSYPVNYDYSQVPSFMTYNNSYNYNYQPNYGYDSSLYFSPNNYYSDHHSSYQTIAYSATTFSDSKSIVYDPNYGMTQFVISYSTLEFNEPEFDEYDPTPYGGGYDISETYGKPLTPSDKICYPRSGSNSIPIIVPEKEAIIDEKPTKPQIETIEETVIEKPQLQDSSIKETSEPYEDEDSDDSEENHDDNYSGSSYGSGFGNGYNGGEIDEPEKQVVTEYPSGYGLETLDICESLFGNWPCLSKMKRENCCENGGINRGNNYYCQENMWKGTADYLFGNPYPYGGRKDDEYGGELMYGYGNGRRY
ncbi:uncharacterized protein [Cicer arietinum]|uniref:Uncharacterized protein At5g39570 n=1 Tax=Cicer arietinum TaxID=3827 RepID=A0A1S2X9K9_CICAR|nr:uncharacterized protein At5g39570 [Cicer arietinum]